MKSITINIFDFEELSKESQKFALEKYKYHIVEFPDWHRIEFNWFVVICKSIGVIIQDEEMYFSWSKDKGSSFKSKIDTEKFIAGIRNKSWRKVASYVDFTFPSCPCDKRVIDLILSGRVVCSWSTDMPSGRYGLDFMFDYQLLSENQTDFSNIISELRKLNEWTIKILNKLNQYLYKSIEQEYERMIDPSILKEYFPLNLIHFTEDGYMAERLLNLAI